MMFARLMSICQSASAACNTELCKHVRNYSHIGGLHKASMVKVVVQVLLTYRNLRLVTEWRSQNGCNLRQISECGKPWQLQDSDMVLFATLAVLWLCHVYRSHISGNASFQSHCINGHQG